MLRLKPSDYRYETRYGWWDLIKSWQFLLGNKRKQYLFWTTILFFIHFYIVIPPLIVGKIVDFFTSYKVGDSLLPFYIYLLILGASFSLVSFIRLSIKKHLGNLRTDIIYNIRVKGFEKLLELSLIANRRETAGEKAQRVQNGVYSFRALTEQINNDIFRAVSAVIGIMFVFLFLNPIYIIFITIYVVVFLGIIKYFYNKIQFLNNELMKAFEKSSGFYIEGLVNILTIKALGAKKSFGSHIAQQESLRKKFEYQIRRVAVGQWIVFQAFNGLCIASFLLLVGRDVLLGSITLGSIVIFYGYLERLTDSAGRILAIYEETIAAKVGIGRMMSIFLTKEKTAQGIKTFPKDWQNIEIKDAGFIYKSKKQKKGSIAGVSDINLKIKRFEKIGIVGKTGSGKSTFGKLLLGLFPLDKGEYRIDNISFYEIKHDEIFKKMALVLQEPEMFNISLRKNITLMRNVKPELLIKAIKISQLEEVIEKLPGGLNTVIGEKGYHLSGGERQRVGIARAICRDPQIIIFDESTSSLDSKTEQLIQDALEKKLDKKTLIFIAHRISTLRNTDKIFVFEKGRIIEEGSYKSLIEDNSSVFYNLYQKQS